jgi:hypothetical protein
VRTDADTDSSGLRGTHASMPMKHAIEPNLGKWEQPMVQGFDAEITAQSKFGNINGGCGVES